MFHYLFQILLFQFLFLLVYDIFHKKDTFFNWNRLYLLATPFLSLVLPFIEIDFLSSDTAEIYVTAIERTLVTSTSVINIYPDTTISKSETTAPINWWRIVYLIGISISIIHLILKFHKLHILRNISTITKAFNKKIIILPNSTHAFSFWNTIFIGDGLKEEEQKNIISHELIHVDQRHTADQIAMELLKIAFWWNPLVYIYQARITLLHEYIADSLTIKTVNQRSYVEQLLNTAFATEKITFINQFFNQSLIKKRILMLQKSQSKSIARCKYLLLIPVIIGILTYTSCTESDTNDVGPTPISDLDQNLANEKEINISNQPKCLNKGAKYDMKLDNYLKIRNGKNSDIIASLISIETEEIVRTVIIYKSQTHYIRNIPEDVYRIDIIYGEGYTEEHANGSCTGVFTKEISRETGKDILDYNTITTDIGISVPSYTIEYNLASDDSNNDTANNSQNSTNKNKNSLAHEEQKAKITPQVPNTGDTKAISYISKEKAEPTCANNDPSRYNAKLNNYLKMTIGASADVIIDLVSLETSESVRTIYLPKNSEYYIRNIPEDIYYLNIIYGDGYEENTINDKCVLSFTNKKLQEKGQDRLDFNTIKSSNGLNVPSYNMNIDMLDDNL